MMFEPKKIADRAKIAKEKGLILDPDFMPFEVESGMSFEINNYKYNDLYDKQFIEIFFYDHKTAVFMLSVDYMNNIKIKRCVGLKTPFKIFEDDVYTWMANFVLIQDLKISYTKWDEMDSEDVKQFDKNVTKLANDIMVEFQGLLTESFTPRNLESRRAAAIEKGIIIHPDFREDVILLKIEDVEYKVEEVLVNDEYQGNPKYVHVVFYFNSEELTWFYLNFLYTRKSDWAPFEFYKIETKYYSKGYDKTYLKNIPLQKIVETVLIEELKEYWKSYKEIPPKHLEKFKESVLKSTQSLTQLVQEYSKG